MYYFAYAPMQLVVGILLDRYGSRILLAGAAVLCAIGMVVFPMSSTEFGLAGSRFLVGFGSSFAFIGAIYVAMVWFPARQVPLLTGLTAGLGFGIGIVGELFAHDLLGKPPAWRSASLVLSIVGMLIAVGMLIVVPKRPAWYLDRTGTREGQTIRGAASGLLKVMARPQIWLISLGCALLYLPLPLAANWGPRSISELLGRPDEFSSQLFAWFYLGIAIGCPLVGWLNGRIGRARPPAGRTGHLREPDPVGDDGIPRRTIRRGMAPRNAAADHGARHQCLRAGVSDGRRSEPRRRQRLGHRVRELRGDDDRLRLRLALRRRGRRLRIRRWTPLRPRSGRLPIHPALGRRPDRPLHAHPRSRSFTPTPGRLTSVRPRNGPTER